MPIRPEVREELMRLPTEERRELADELYESVDGPADPEWEKAWSQELRKRMHEIREGKVQGVPAHEAHAEMRDYLRSLRNE